MTITQKKSNSIRSLYTRLGTVGFNRTYVKNVVLPDWWDDEIAENPTGYAQAVSIIARNLGLDLQSLQNQESPIVRYDLGPRRFKRRKGVSEEELETAGCIALRAAQLACLASPDPIQDLPASASALRGTILESGVSWVTFEALLDTCWNCGIPVLHVAKFPEKSKKMDGLAARIGGRPAIILSSKHKHSAWLEFDLGHEMGHIGRGHIKDDDVLIEDERQKTEDAEGELEATEYAVELLTGNPEIQYTSSQRLSASELANKAMAQGKADHADPGAIVLNYAKSTEAINNNWPVATNALKIIEPHPNAISLVHAKMCERLEWDRLPEESQAFLMRVTGADSDA